MSNLEVQVYDFDPIKKPVWFAIGLYVIRHFGDVNGYSVFKVNPVGTDILYKFSVTTSLIIASIDDDNMEVSLPEKFKIIKSLIDGYIKKNCQILK